MRIGSKAVGKPIVVNCTAATPPGQCFFLKPVAAETNPSSLLSLADGKLMTANLSYCRFKMLPSAPQTS